MGAGGLIGSRATSSLISASGVWDLEDIAIAMTEKKWPGIHVFDAYIPSAAFSVRKLRHGYSGACLQVRRSSDNTLQDIGFNGDILDTAALLAFVGAGSGYVRTWYDQSGNSRNVAMTTDDTKQPLIVSAGTLLVNSNGNPVLRFDGANDYLINTSYPTGINACGLYGVFKVLGTAGEDVYIGIGAAAANSCKALFRANGSAQFKFIQYNADSVAEGGTVDSGGSHHCFAATQASTVVQLAKDGAVTNTTVPSVITTSIGSLCIGELNASGSRFAQMDMSEAVVFHTGTSAYTADIHTDQKSFYGIA